MKPYNKKNIPLAKMLPQSPAVTAPSSDGAFCTAAQGKTVYALGFFDGVHRGHQALLSACCALAAETGAKAGVATFTGHPDGLVQGKAPMLINTYADRRRLLIHYNIEEVLELPFDRALMEMPWQNFLKKLRPTAAGFVCGEDFRFGYKGEGTAAILQQYCKAEGIPCVVVPQMKLGEVPVSSTHIRRLLTDGEMEKAVDFLGHPHILTGKVEKGRQLGRTIGIPTANLTFPEGVVLPRLGVYACKTRIDGKTYLAVTNIGTRPTVEGHHITVEPWILDFDGDLYGKELTLEFHAFLRTEQKFPTLEDLKAEIHKNAEKTRFLLQNS